MLGLVQPLLKQQQVPQRLSMAARAVLSMGASGTVKGLHLPSAPLAILGSLDDSRQVQHLDLGPPVVHHSGDACQGRELVRRNLCIMSPETSS